MGAVRFDPLAHLGDHRSIAHRHIVTIEVVLVVGADVARLLGPLPLFHEGLDHGTLNLFACHGVDRVGDVGVQLGPPIVIPHGAVLIELGAALVAEPRPEVVLAGTFEAAIRELAARHRHENTLGTFDNLQVPDNEGIIEGDRAEREQPLAIRFAQLDADFRDDHRGSPSCGIRGLNYERLALAIRALREDGSNEIVPPPKQLHRGSGTGRTPPSRSRTSLPRMGPVR